MKSKVTYRVGAYVVDTRDDRIAEVIGAMGRRVRVRGPGGGPEWDVPFASLRLATREEREKAGVRGTRSPLGCTECADLEAARRQAVAHGEEEAFVDATVAVRSHFRDAHLLPRSSW